MPEIKHKQLPGIVVEGRSTDSFISKTVDQMRADIGGVTGQIVNVTTSEIYAPIAGIVRPASQGLSTEVSSSGGTDSSEKLTHAHSKLAMRIRSRRESHRQQEEKAA